MREVVDSYKNSTVDFSRSLKECSLAEDEGKPKQVIDDFSEELEDVAKKIDKLEIEGKINPDIEVLINAYGNEIEQNSCNRNTLISKLMHREKKCPYRSIGEIVKSSLLVGSIFGLLVAIMVSCRKSANVTSTICGFVGATIFFSLVAGGIGFYKLIGEKKYILVERALLAGAYSLYSMDIYSRYSFVTSVQGGEDSYYITQYAISTPFGDRIVDPELYRQAEPGTKLIIIKADTEEGKMVSVVADYVDEANQ